MLQDSRCRAHREMAVAAARQTSVAQKLSDCFSTLRCCPFGLINNANYLLRGIVNLRQLCWPVQGPNPAVCQRSSTHTSRQITFLAGVPTSRQAYQANTPASSCNPRHATGCSSSTASSHVNDDLDRPSLRGALKHVVRALHVRQLEAVRDQLARAQAPQRCLHSVRAPFQVLGHT